MLVLLLLVSRVTCEWVEISQNHYRKEPPRQGTLVHIEENDRNEEFKDYRNQSILEKQWNKAVIDRVSNVGNIRRVQVPSVKTPSIKPSENFHEHTGDSNSEINRHRPFQKVDISVSNQDLYTKVSRTSTTATPGRAKPINGHLGNNHKSSSNNEFNQRKIIIDQKISNTNWNENKMYTVGGSVTDDGQVRYDNDKYDYGVPSENEKIFGQNKLVSINEFEDKLLTSRSGTQEFAERSDRVDYFKKVTLQNNEFPNLTITNKPKFHITKIDNIHLGYNNEYSTEINKDALKTKTPLKPGVINQTPKDNLDSLHENRNIFLDFKDVSNATKIKSLSGMWKLMKVVTDTIYKNTHRSFKSKIKYLEDLRTTITTCIENHIDSVWPDEVEHRSVRRSARSEARGHLEFPSSESTLMTISFLTFAVFLIKLVLQVIHTYKNKTMMVTPTVVAAVGRAAAAMRAKHV